jgi:membrane protein YqaA with SNARE-associated domain
VLDAVAVVGSLALGPSSVVGAVLDIPLHFHHGVYRALEAAVARATGPLGLVIIFIYSFLIAFALPLPSEIVLATPLRLGLPYAVEIGIIMLVSGAGKACGSVFAFAIGHQAKEAGPIVRFFERSRFDVIGWSERRTVGLAQRYGYIGLAMALSVPFFPDTLSIYAFSVLEEDYLKFAAATFVGSVGRLLVTVGLLGGAAAVI